MQTIWRVTASKDRRIDVLRNHTRQERWARACRPGCQDRLEKIGITIQGVMTASELAGGIPTGNYSNQDCG